MSKQARKQESKQESEQASKRTSKQANERTREQASLLFDGEGNLYVLPWTLHVSSNQLKKMQQDKCSETEWAILTTIYLKDRSISAP